jgi:predicted O-methyltransferase YrrM
LDATEGFLSDIPNLHSWDEGLTWNTGGFSRLELEYFISLVRNIGSHAVIGETGAGASTIAFLLAQPKRIISIAPDKALFSRIQAYCDAHKIDTSSLDKHVCRSEEALPQISLERMESKELFDLVLIDGNHGWPTVFVDFCYFYRSLRVGGLLVVDDLNLYSVKELVRLRTEDPAVRVVNRVQKTILFEKISDRAYLRDFHVHYIARRTQEENDAGTSFVI